MKSKPVDRRMFLGQSSSTAAGLAALGTVWASDACKAQGRKPTVSVNDKATVGLIGCGGMGKNLLHNFIKTGRVSVGAVCDVDEGHLAEAVAQVGEKINQRPQAIKDYREVIDRSDIDTVIIATPDHWHAAPMMLACQAGKNIYVEKPCSHNIREARLMLDAAEKHQVTVQVGTHQRSMPHIQELKQIVASGGLGKISMTETFTYGNESPRGLGSSAKQSAPTSVDYDAWLGPAPKHPFNPRRFHSTWRWFFDYASGMVGDWNVHLQDTIMWTLGAQQLRSVSTVGGKFVLTDDRDTPDTMVATYEFGPCQTAPNGFVHTYMMRKASGRPWQRGGYGMQFHGTNGRAFADRRQWYVDPDEQEWTNSRDHTLRCAKQSGKGEDRHLAHVVNFLDAVRDGHPTVANIDSHFHSVVACHLANVSYRVGRKIFWNAKHETCYQDAQHQIPDMEANRYLTREYRQGYELPNV